MSTQGYNLCACGECFPSSSAPPLTEQRRTYRDIFICISSRQNYKRHKTERAASSTSLRCQCNTRLARSRERNARQTSQHLQTTWRRWRTRSLVLASHTTWLQSVCPAARSKGRDFLSLRRVDVPTNFLQTPLPCDGLATVFKTPSRPRW